MNIVFTSYPPLASLVNVDVGLAINWTTCSDDFEKAAAVASVKTLTTSSVEVCPPGLPPPSVVVVEPVLRLPPYALVDFLSCRTGGRNTSSETLAEAPELSIVITVTLLSCRPNPVEKG